MKPLSETHPSLAGKGRHVEHMVMLGRNVIEVLQLSEEELTDVPNHYMKGKKVISEVFFEQDVQLHTIDKAIVERDYVKKEDAQKAINNVSKEAVRYSMHEDCISRAKVREALVNARPITNVDRALLNVWWELGL